MTGRKVELAFIVNNHDRKVSYRRRKKSLLKKMEELSTLCGVEACAIVYSSFDQEPQIWPSESGVQNVVEKFRTVPEWKKNKMGNQESVIETSIVKCKKKIRKLEKENKEVEMNMFMFQWLNTSRAQPQHNMTLADLNLLSSVIEQKLNCLIKKMSEISILCGIQASAIIYTPDDPNQQEVWPSASGVHSMISRFRSASELEQSKKMFSQQSFLRQKIIKGKEQLKKLRSENRKKEVDILISQYLSARDNLDKASIIDLNDISFMTDQKLAEIRRKITTRQAQLMTPVTENEGEPLNQGEQAQVNHVDTNVDATQNLNWSMDFISADGGNEILTMEDVNVLGGWFNQYIP
ncbi:unnamed protein product [Sphenostylis stenocarpa]|uniref:MADS-box domain-containing protein n=1 Tax=Sphenostylis stenocarpa TaxID=92480 RepID=A0AA86VJD8_9FABA|nr:unnamed protein product [Sphenostylis stenocarpa]